MRENAFAGIYVKKLVWVFLHTHTLCIRGAKDLESLCICVDLHESLLLDNKKGTKSQVLAQVFIGVKVFYKFCQWHSFRWENSEPLTLKAPITTAADDKCCLIFPNLEK